MQSIYDQDDGQQMKNSHMQLKFCMFLLLAVNYMREYISFQNKVFKRKILTVDQKWNPYVFRVFLSEIFISSLSCCGGFIDSAT